MAEPWIQTYSGKAIDILDPKPEQIVLNDFCIALSRIPRFNGHTIVPWSVAQHLLLCNLIAAQESAEVRLAVLLHDFHEAVTGDITSPMKMAIGPAVSKIQYGVDVAIFNAINATYMSSNDVFRVDLVALATEKKYLMAQCERPWSVDAVPYDALSSIGAEPRHIAEALNTAVRYAIKACGLTPLPSFLA